MNEKKSKLNVVYTVIIVLLFVFGLLFLMRSCSRKYDNYYLSGKVQLYKINNKNYIAGLYKYEKCTGYSSEGGITNISMHYYYYLQTRDADTGLLIKETELIKIKRERVKLLGGKNNYVWLLIANKFHVFDIITHENFSGNEMIENKNSFLVNNIPDSEQYIKFDEYDKSLHIVAKNGMFYEIDCATFMAMEEKEEKQYDNKIKDEINDLSLSGISGKEITSGIIYNNNIYAVLSENELKSRYLPDATSINYGVNRRRLYISTANSDDWDTAIQSVDKWTLLEKNNVYLNGGFLRNPSDLKTIILDNPTSFLILHKKQIGDAALLIITRTDFSGMIVWSKELPLVKINSLILTENKLIILSNDGKEITGNDKNNIYLLIDLKTGEYSSIDLLSQIKKQLKYYLF